MLAVQGSGKWRLEPKTYELVHCDGYPIDLETMTSRNEIDDWIRHVSRKTWGDSQTVSELKQALSGLLPKVASSPLAIREHVDTLVRAAADQGSVATMGKSKTEKSEKKGEERWTEDDMGVVSWCGGANGEAWDHGKHDPFEKWLKAVNASSAREPKAVTDVAHVVRDNLEAARSVSLSIFGRSWESHVLEIYDRLVAAKK